MASRKWDAYRTLNITSRESNGMTCVGNNRYGKRCRWDTPHQKYMQICTILDELETKPPTKAISSLNTLARLSLCEDYHQGQAYDKIDEWKCAIQESALFYENGGGGLKERNRELEELLEEERAIRDSLEREWGGKYERGMRVLREQAAQQLKVQMERDLSSYQQLAKSHEIRMAEARNLIADLNSELEEERKASVLHSETAQALETTKRCFARAKIVIYELKTQAKTREEDSKARGFRMGELDRQHSLDLSLISDTAEQLEVTDRRNSELQSELMYVENTLKVEVERGEGLQTQLDTMTQTESGLRSSLRDVQSARDTLQEELSSERHNAALLAEDLDTTKHLLSNAQEEHATTREEFLGTKKTLEAVQGNLLKIQKETEDLQRKGLERESELSSELKEIKHILSNVQEELKAAQDEAAGTKKSFQAVQANLAKTQSNMEDVQRTGCEKESEISKQIRALTQEIEYLKSHLVKSFIKGLPDRLGSWTRASIEWFSRLTFRGGHAVT